MASSLANPTFPTSLTAIPLMSVSAPSSPASAPISLLTATQLRSFTTPAIAVPFPSGYGGQQQVFLQTSLTEAANPSIVGGATASAGYPSAGSYTRHGTSSWPDWATIVVSVVGGCLIFLVASLLLFMMLRRKQRSRQARASRTTRTRSVYGGPSSTAPLHGRKRRPHVKVAHQTRRVSSPASSRRASRIATSPRSPTFRPLSSDYRVGPNGLPRSLPMASTRPAASAPSSPRMPALVIDDENGYIDFSSGQRHSSASRRESHIKRASHMQAPR